MRVGEGACPHPAYSLHTGRSFALPTCPPFALDDRTPCHPERSVSWCDRAKDLRGEGIVGRKGWLTHTALIACPSLWMTTQGGLKTPEPSKNTQWQLTSCCSLEVEFTCFQFVFGFAVEEIFDDEG